MTADTVSLDWSGAFILNGRLLHYEVYRRDTGARYMKIYTGMETRLPYLDRRYEQGKLQFTTLMGLPCAYMPFSEGMTIVIQ